MNGTPVTPDGLRMYDETPPLDAALVAWKEAGDRPDCHYDAQRVMRRVMPLVARSLDRAAYGIGLPDSHYGRPA